MKTILCILGPTASGKSSLGLQLAELLGGEIVGCDSVQVFKGFDIGSSKATSEEQARVPHHLIDVGANREISCGALHGSRRRSHWGHHRARENADHCRGHQPLLSGVAPRTVRAPKFQRLFKRN